MLRIANMKSRRFWVIDDMSRKEFWIDVIEPKHWNQFEAWIMEREGGVAHLMFACPAEQPNGQNIDFDGFVKMVRNNVQDYIDTIEWED